MIFFSIKKYFFQSFNNKWKTEKKCMKILLENIFLVLKLMN